MVQQHQSICQPLKEGCDVEERRRRDRRTKLDGFAKEEHVVGVVAAAVRIVWTE